MSVYPSSDIERASQRACESASEPAAMQQGQAACGAAVADISPFSPADDAGFTPGCRIMAVDGEPLTDILAWQWLSAEDEMTLTYRDADGDEGELVLERDSGEPWGFTFDGAIFDGVRQCRNACTFCFMRQLPRGLRPALTLRDDDYRLSFLDGTFVTFTNLTAADEERIVRMGLSPLRYSLHAVSHDVRRRLIGRYEAHGLECLERLLDAGIRFDVQIVLVPGENDGDELERTLAWAYGHPGIVQVGIVPLGYTRYQDRFSCSFDDPDAARTVVLAVEPFAQRALRERGVRWVFCADEFYVNAFGEQVGESLPSASEYGEYEMYEDGVGMLRSFACEMDECVESGLAARAREALLLAHRHAVLYVGESAEPFMAQRFAQAGLAEVLDVVAVRNGFFGGNVSVTGLLTAADAVPVIRRCEARWPNALHCLPANMFNADRLTLDDCTVASIEKAAGASAVMVSCSACDFCRELIAAAQEPYPSF